MVGPDKKVERRQIEIGPQVKDKQVVLSGLEAGEAVVVSGIQKVKPGDTVEPVFGDSLEEEQ